MTVGDDGQIAASGVVQGPEPSMIDFNRVTKRFPDGTLAIRDVSLSISRGEFVSILGPSGCGKSTLLRVAASLERCSEGSCTVRSTGLGYVFQDPTLLPWRTVRRNVSLPAELHGISSEEIRERVSAAISMVGLDGAENQLPHQLSGGMRMRASLARSLVLRPDLFLFDEPFGALDDITRARLNEELMNIYRSVGFTGLLVTHSVSEAVFLSTRVVVLSRRPGRICGVIDVPFAFPRAGTLRYEPDFSRVCGHVASMLREAST